MAFIDECCSPVFPPKAPFLLETSKPPVDTAHVEETKRPQKSIASH